MKPFAYERAATPRRPWRCVARHPGRAFLGGGTNLVDLMQLGVETPDAARRRHAAAARPASRAARRRAADRRRRPQQRPGRRPARPRRYPVLAQALLAGRVRPAAQHGDDRRQPAPAHALRLLPGRHEAVQQARAGHRAARRARATTATTRSSGTRDACVATHPSDMAVALAALDATACIVPGRRPASGGPDRRASPAARRRARARHRARRRGELITAVELPPLPFARPLDVPQGARPRVVRVRARRRSRPRSTCDDGTVARRADRARRRRAQAVARARGRGGAARRAGDAGALRRGRRRRARRRRRRCATTPSRSPLARTTCSSGTLPELARDERVDRPRRDRRRRSTASRAARRSRGEARYAYEHDAGRASPTR